MTRSEEPIERQKKPKSVATQAAWMASGTMVSRITGYLRESILFSMFDRYVTDAFVVAWRLPNLFRRMLGEGSLAVSFIPVFMEQLTGGNQHAEERSKPAYDLACAMFSLLLAILLAICTLGFIFMEPIIDLVASGKGFASIPGKMDLAVHLGRIMFGFIFFISLYAFFTSLLQSLKHFALAAVAPALLNVSIIVACYLPQEMFSVRGESLAWAVLVGGFLQMAVLMPLLAKKGYLPSPRKFFGHQGVGQVLRAMGPSMLGMGVLQLMALVNVRFASQLPEGSHSYIYMADRVLELPLSLFAVSLGSAMLPTLSSFWAKGEKTEMVSACHRYMRMVYIVSVPSAFGLYFLAQPIIETLFMRGQFSQGQAITAASLVQIYAFTLISASGVRVLAPAFYAVKNTKIPAVASVVALTFHIVLAYKLLPVFGIHGLVGSTVASSFVNLLVLSIMFNRTIGAFAWGALLKSVLVYLVCGAVMAMAIQMYQPTFHTILKVMYGPTSLVFLAENSVLVQVLRAAVLLLTIGVGAVTYFVAGKLLRVPEAETLMRTVGRKLNLIR